MAGLPGRRMADSGVSRVPVKVPVKGSFKGSFTQRVHIHYYYGIRSPNHNGDGLLGPNSIIVVYMDPLG